jgi:hypothetical protein
MMVTFEDLDRLKQALHPAEKMDVVEQCRIVAEALSPEGVFPNSLFKVAEYVKVSKNKIYKMKMIHQHTIPAMKEWLKGTAYQSDKAYRLSTLTSDDQLAFTKLTDDDKMVFFKEMRVLEEPVEESVVESSPAPTEVK